MRKQLILLAISFVFPICLCAQKTKTECVKEILRIETNISVDEAQKRVLQRARINAIIQAFGEVVIQGNSTFIRNVDNGSQVKSETVFNMIADTYVNGDWIRDIDVPVYRRYQENNQDWIEVSVCCEIRELSKRGVDFKVSTLSCPDLKCKTDVFNNGQDFYLLFQSPVDGFLTVYLEVPNDAVYRLLPYSTDKTSTCIQVKGDEEYIFFDGVKDDLPAQLADEELFLDLAKPNIQEQNAVVVIFSKDYLEDKPILNRTNTQTTGNASIDEFERWVLKAQKKHKSFEVSKKYIVINPIK
jgi:hypothetical protein